MFWYFFTYNEFDHNTQPHYITHNTTNITTMVVELLAPPAAWIQ